jgi:hypothetical protein
MRTAPRPPEIRVLMDLDREWLREDARRRELERKSKAR